MTPDIEQAIRFAMERAARESEAYAERHEQTHGAAYLAGIAISDRIRFLAPAVIAEWEQRKAAAQENKAEAASSGADFKATDLGAGTAAPDSKSRSLPNNPAAVAPSTESTAVGGYHAGRKPFVGVMPPAPEPAGGMPEEPAIVDGEVALADMLEYCDKLCAHDLALQARVRELEHKNEGLLVQLDIAEAKLREAERDAEELRGKLGEIKACFLGIDQQAQKLMGPPSTNWKDEEIIVGYKLNTGLWHRLHGLLADVNAALAARGEKEKR